MKTPFTLILTLLWSMTIFAQTGIPIADMSHCDTMVMDFLTAYDIPGASLAVAKDGKLVYARGFGSAGTELTQPHHMFRLASVSKPITAITIMKLIEEGRLSLNDTVFGPAGLLANHSYLNNVVYTDTRIDSITVQHLLEHSAGWDRTVDCIIGPAPPYTWSPSQCDPIAFPLHVTHTLQETNPVRREVLIRFLMEKGLNFDPGTSFGYSNVGFLILGEIIDEITGMAYESYVKDSLLSPLGICDMHIGKTFLTDRHLREVIYYNDFTGLSVDGSGSTVPYQYGGFGVESMDAAAGWIATARDLVRLLSAVDGFPTRPDILSPSTLQSMTGPSTTSPVFAGNAFAQGWIVDSANNWWFDGELGGNASYILRSDSNGYLYAFLANRFEYNYDLPSFFSDFYGLPWDCLLNTTSWPAHDFFDVPSSSQNLGITADNTSGQVSLSWNAGNGDSSIVVAREEGSIIRFPLDGSTYTHNSQFGQGEDLWNGHFVVYKGTGNQAIVTGLTPGKAYYFQVFDYNSRASTSNFPLYQLCGAPVNSISLQSTTSISKLSMQGIRCYPNPGNSFVQLSWNTPDQMDHIEVRNLQGQLITRETVEGTDFHLGTEGWPAQMYLIACFRQGNYLGSLRWIKR